MLPKLPHLGSGEVKRGCRRDGFPPDPSPPQSHVLYNQTSVYSPHRSVHLRCAGNSLLSRNTATRGEGSLLSHTGDMTVCPCQSVGVAHHVAICGPPVAEGMAVRWNGCWHVMVLVRGCEHKLADTSKLTHVTVRAGPAMSIGQTILRVPPCLAAFQGK